MVSGGRPLLPKILGQPTPIEAKGGLKNAKRPISIKKCTSLEESLLQSFFV